MVATYRMKLKNALFNRAFCKVKNYSHSIVAGGFEVQS